MICDATDLETSLLQRTRKVCTRPADSAVQVPARKRAVDRRAPTTACLTDLLVNRAEQTLSSVCCCSAPGTTPANCTTLTPGVRQC
jgi:hypothetical protein